MAKRRSRTSKAEIAYSLFLLVVIAIGASTLYYTAGSLEALARDFAVTVTSLAFILLIAQPLLKKSIFA